MILSVNHITKAFLDDTVLKDATFHIEDREKAALVGNNGAGKSTLFKILAGKMAADSGEFFLSKGAAFGYLSQHEDLDSDAPIFEEVLSIRKEVADLELEMRALEKQIEACGGHDAEALLKRLSNLQEKFDSENGYAIRSEVTGVLKGLGFTEEDFKKNVSTCSGGEKTRIALCKLLLIKPDLLLLDEPTNHLDIHAVSWLESYLSNYPGAVFIVSHDRYFLDRLVTKVVDLSMGTTHSYLGNYSDFVIKKMALLEAKMREYEKQQDEIKHQEKVIATLRSFNREKSIKRAMSREKRLEKMERIEKPREENNEMRLHLTPRVLSGNDVLTVTGLSKQYDGRVLFDRAGFEITRGERVCLIGDNGTGKSTLLKILTGLRYADSGEVRFGSNVQIGYYDQEHQTLDPEKTIFSEISDAYPTMTNEEIRNMLAAFLFTGDDVFKRISELSGGEKGRVSLAKLMLSDANFLILDEPTNHLDMTSREILENALTAYEGTILSVSHDRYFINETSTRILELYGKTFISSPGDYDYFLEKRDLLHARYVTEAPKAEKASGGDLEWRRKKEEDAKRRKAENDLKKAEQEIEALEAEIAKVDSEFENPEISSNAEALNELSKTRQELEKKLETAYEKWENFA